jgi:putative flippase GtrA
MGMERMVNDGGHLALWRRLSALAGVALHWGAQLHKYTLVGGAVFLLDLLSFWALLLLVGDRWYVLVNLASRSLGGISCFLGNRYITFRHRTHGHFWSDLLRFCMLYFVSLALSTGLVYAGVEWMGMRPVAGKAAAEIAVFLFNYTVMKYWVLRPATK